VRLWLRRSRVRSRGSPSLLQVKLEVREVQILYPADHMVAFAQSARNPLVDAQITWVSIGGIPNAHEAIHGLVTLFIPPASKPTIRDHELVCLFDDPAHLNAITEGEVGWREGEY
jgi:hypothetical protein